MLLAWEWVHVGADHGDERVRIKADPCPFPILRLWRWWRHR